LSSAEETPRVINVTPEKQHLLTSFEAGQQVLTREAPLIRAAADLLGMLAQEEVDQVMLTGAAEAATDTDIPVTSAFEVLPMISEAVAPFSPTQPDASRAATERWTQNWGEIGARLKARLAEKPEVQASLTDWFLHQGAAMVETTYASGEDSPHPLYIIVGGANDQCWFRPLLSLASMASPAFRQAQGLVTVPNATLNGEDGRASGWMQFDKERAPEHDNGPGWIEDQHLPEALRQHLAQRIAAGELQPRIIVGGSAAQGRVLKEKEAGVVSKYFVPGTEPLYAPRGWTEADAMLAGALRAFGHQEDAQLEVEELPAADPGELPAKVISFESAVGKVTVIATTGSEASLAGQLAKLQAHKPDLFSDVDKIYAPTTAIYTWVQRPALLEAAARAGLSAAHATTLGLSAHAAGIPRNPEVLVGELTNYLKAVQALAMRSIEAAEQNASYDIRQLGGTAVVGVQPT
jgi:hypothetical protein